MDVQLSKLSLEKKMQRPQNFLNELISSALYFEKNLALINVLIANII